jgi:hypothetical protein
LFVAKRKNNFQDALESPIVRTNLNNRLNDAAKSTDNDDGDSINTPPGNLQGTAGLDKVADNQEEHDDNPSGTE